jgi:hypothetical protein
LSHRAAPAREISLPKEKARGTVGKTPEIGTRRRWRLPQYLVEKVLENGNIKRLWQSEKKIKRVVRQGVWRWWWQQAADAMEFGNGAGMRRKKREKMKRRNDWA